MSHSSVLGQGRADGLQSQTEFHCTPVVFHFQKEDCEDGYSQVIEKVIEPEGFSWVCVGVGGRG